MPSPSLHATDTAERRLMTTWFASAELPVCLVALFAGCGQLMLADNTNLFWFNTVLLSLCGLFGLLRCVLTPQAMTTWLVMASTLALGYGIGTLNTLASGYSDQMSLMYLTFAHRSGIAEATALLLILFSMLLVIGRLDPNKILKSFNESPSLDKITATALAVTCSLLVWVFIAAGKIGLQMGIAAEEGSANVSVVGAIIVMALGPLSALAIYELPNLTRFHRYILSGSAAAMMMAIATQGRRFFLFSLICCAIAYVASQKNKKIFTTKNIILGVLAIAVAFGASRVFYAMRMAKSEVRGETHVLALLDQAVNTMMNDRRGELASQLNENQQTRTFIIGYLSELVEVMQYKAPLYGQLLEFGLASAVPSAIWPGKWRIMSYGSEEVLAHPQLGMPIWDAANSVVTAGICDFGLIGFFGYPLAMALLASLAIRATKKLSGPSYLIFAFGLVFVLLSVETSITGYTSSIRNLIILAAIAQIFHFGTRAQQFYNVGFMKS